MAFVNYAFRLVNYDGTTLIMLWRIDDILGSNPNNPDYTSLAPFDTGLSWNLLRRLFGNLLDAGKGIPERIEAGYYVDVEGGLVYVDRNDLALADIAPSGVQFRGIPGLEKKSWYSTITLTYKPDTWTPPSEDLDDPRYWSIPSPDGDATRCLGGGGESGGGGASAEWGFIGKSDGGFLGVCEPGAGSWHAIYAYDEGGDQAQYVHIAYFTEEVSLRWSSWLRHSADMMKTDPAGSAMNGGDIWTRIYNYVKSGGYEWYVENVTDEPLSHFDYKYGPRQIYPQGWFLYARGCPLPNINAKSIIPGNGVPPTILPRAVPFEMKLFQAARLGLDVRPYEVMIHGQKVYINGEQVTIGDPEAA